MSYYRTPDKLCRRRGCHHRQDWHAVVPINTDVVIGKCGDCGCGRYTRAYGRVLQFITGIGAFW